MKKIKNIRKQLQSQIWHLRNKPGSVSYAQSGEDVIAGFLLIEQLRFDIVRYLDIGAGHPAWLSNTYFFYKRGFTGVCVDPYPGLLGKYKILRPNEIFLNVGIRFSDEDSAVFYMMDRNTHSTFCYARVKQAAEEGFNVKNVINVPLISINDVLNAYFPDGLEFLSIDIEGFEFQVLKAIDWSFIRPVLICSETLEESEKVQITELMESVHYKEVARTPVNTFYLDRRTTDR